MAALSLLGFLASWTTPTSLFVFLNLVIGTIFITSRFTSTSDRKPQPPLATSHSLLDRVKSNLSLYKFPEPEIGFVMPEPDHPVHLQRAPSLLERFRSINFSSLYHHEPEPEPSTDHPTNLRRAPSLLERFGSINFSSLYHQEPKPEPGTGHPTNLQRVPSLLERVRSINVASLYRHEQEVTPEQEEDDTRGPGSEHQVKRSKSEPREERQVAAGKIKKSASERAAVTMEDEEEEEEEEVERRRPKSTSVLEKTVSFGDDTVDAKADDFINRFKQHLKLQRLDSILRSRGNAHRELEH